MCYLTEGANNHLEYLDSIMSNEPEHYCFVDGALYRESEMIFVTYKGDWINIDNVNEYLELVAENENQRDFEIIKAEVNKFLYILKK
jgi:hypothetical protein